MSRLRDPESAIEIIANPQSDGCNFELHPLSKRKLRERYPQISAAPSVFIGFDTRDHFESIHGKMWNQVVSLLTGITSKRLKGLGGVYVFDPKNNRVVYEDRPAKTAGSAHA